MVFDAMTAGSLRMTIDPDTNRNHCPYCLTSLHLDVAPGDRAADCGGRMEAVAVWVRRDGEWALIHRCARCGALSSNRIAADDNPLLLMSLLFVLVPSLIGSVSMMVIPSGALAIGLAYLSFRRQQKEREDSK